MGSRGSGCENGATSWITMVDESRPPEVVCQPPSCPTQQGLNLMTFGRKTWVATAESGGILLRVWPLGIHWPRKVENPWDRLTKEKMSDTLFPWWHFKLKIILTKPVVHRAQGGGGIPIWLNFHGREVTTVKAQIQQRFVGQSPCNALAFSYLPPRGAAMGAYPGTFPLPRASLFVRQTSVGISRWFFSNSRAESNDTACSSLLSLLHYMVTFHFCHMKLAC